MWPCVLLLLLNAIRWLIIYSESSWPIPGCHAEQSEASQPESCFVALSISSHGGRSFALLSMTIGDEA